MRPFAAKIPSFLSLSLSHCEIAIEIGFTKEIYDRIRRNFCVSNCVLLAVDIVSLRKSDAIELITMSCAHHSITFILWNTQTTERQTHTKRVKECVEQTSICTTIISWASSRVKLNKIDLMLRWFTCVNPERKLIINLLGKLDIESHTETENIDPRHRLTMTTSYTKPFVLRLRVFVLCQREKWQNTTKQT